MSSRFEELLICEVYARQCLWNTRAPNYKDTASRKKAWKSIAETLNVKEVEAERKWKSLRSVFLMNLKKLAAKPPGSLNQYKVKWKHFDSMVFLKDHIECRKTDYSFNMDDYDLGNDANNIGPDAEEEEIDEATVTESHHQATSSGAIECLDIVPPGVGSSGSKYSPPMPTDNIFACKKRSAVEDHLLETLKESYDADMSFLKSLAPSLRVIPEDAKDDAKIELLQVVQKYKRLCKHSSTSPPIFGKR